MGAKGRGGPGGMLYSDRAVTLPTNIIHGCGEVRSPDWGVAFRHVVRDRGIPPRSRDRARFCFYTARFCFYTAQLTK